MRITLFEVYFDRSCSTTSTCALHYSWCPHPSKRRHYQFKATLPIFCPWLNSHNNPSASFHLRPICTCSSNPVYREWQKLKWSLSVQNWRSSLKRMDSSTSIMITWCWYWGRQSWTGLRPQWWSTMRRFMITSHQIETQVVGPSRRIPIRHRVANIKEIQLIYHHTQCSILDRIAHLRSEGHPQSWTSPKRWRVLIQY